MWSHAYRVRVGAAISARTFTLVTMVSVVSPVHVLRHAGLGRPAGHADTPLDDQQAGLGRLAGHADTPLDDQQAI